MIREKLEDFDRWKPHYDQNAAFRRQSGCKSQQLFRSSVHPNEITLLYGWDNLENARKFAQSQHLKEVMERAGVISREFHFLDQVERGLPAEEPGKKVA